MAEACRRYGRTKERDDLLVSPELALASDLEVPLDRMNYFRFGVVWVDRRLAADHPAEIAPYFRLASGDTMRASSAGQLVGRNRLVEALTLEPYPGSDQECPAGGLNQQ